MNGWAMTPLMSRFHYFDDGMALCGHWMYTGEVDEQACGTKPSRLDCKECWRKRKKQETA